MSVNFVAQFSESETSFNVGFAETSSDFSASFSDFTILDHDVYSGEYTITPKADSSKVLATKDKLLTDNVTVLKIPYEAVSNEQDGLTVTIAMY